MFEDTKKYIDEIVKEAFIDGMNLAWECARKIAQTMKRDEITTCFGERDEIGRKMIFEEYSASEAIAKIKEYGEKQKQTEDEIKVGYEVYNLDPENKRIVTAIDGNKAIQLCSNGKYTVDNIDTLHWTGREDLRIKKVLEKITNEV